MCLIYIPANAQCGCAKHYVNVCLNAIAITKDKTLKYLLKNNNNFPKTEQFFRQRLNIFSINNIYSQNILLFQFK